MKASHGLFCYLGAVVLWSSTSISVLAKESGEEEVTYFINPPALAKDRCFLGFEVTIVNGLVVDASNLPSKSSIDIVNSSSMGADPDNRTRIHSSVQMGVMAPEEIRAFHFRVLKQTNYGPKFDISGSLEVTECGPDAPDPTLERQGLNPENFKVIGKRKSLSAP